MSEEKKPEDKREPLTDEDILGGLVDVIFKRAIPSRSLPGAILFIVEYEGKEYRFGTLNKEAFEAVRKKGYKRDGVIHLMVPRTCLREEGCGWITGPY
jgi:hypothetical protein